VAAVKDFCSRFRFGEVLVTANDRANGEDAGGYKGCRWPVLGRAMLILFKVARRGRDLLLASVPGLVGPHKCRETTVGKSHVTGKRDTCQIACSSFCAVRASIAWLI